MDVIVWGGAVGLSALYWYPGSEEQSYILRHLPMVESQFVTQRRYWTIVPLSVGLTAHIGLWLWTREAVTDRRNED